MIFTSWMQAYQTDRKRKNLPTDRKFLNKIFVRKDNCFNFVKN